MWNIPYQNHANHICSVNFITEGRVHGRFLHDSLTAGHIWNKMLQKDACRMHRKDQAHAECIPQKYPDAWIQHSARIDLPG